MLHPGGWNTSTEVSLRATTPTKTLSIQLVGLLTSSDWQGPLSAIPSLRPPAGSDVTNSAPFETLQFDGSASYDNDGLAHLPVGADPAERLRIDPEQLHQRDAHHLPLRAIMWKT